MKAIILAGGKGTRLRPLTYTTPKPLIDVQGKTLTEHIFDVLKKYEIQEVILSLGYMADKVKNYFESKDFGLKIEYLTEDQPMGTAGPLLLLKKIGCPMLEDFLVMNGDNLFSLDLSALKDFHQSKGGIGTIALTEVEDPTSRGVAKLDNDKIVNFIEKPSREEAPSNFINSGYYIFSPKVFDFLPDKDFVMTEKDIFPELASRGLLYGFRGQGQWFDSDNYERYENVKNNWRGV